MLLQASPEMCPCEFGLFEIYGHSAVFSSLVTISTSNPGLRRHSGRLQSKSESVRSPELLGFRGFKGQTKKKKKKPTYLAAQYYGFVDMAACS